MLTKPRYVLAVTDLDRSTEFYESLLGFNIISKFDGWVFLKRDSVVLMIGECRDAGDASSLGDHSYFAYIDTDDAGGLFSELESKGVDFIKRLADEPWGMREFGIKTIDGHRIMFGQDMSQTPKIA